MKTYSYKDKPIEVHGVPFFEKTGRLERLPQSVRDAVPSLAGLGRRCPGARICFRTNSSKITLKMVFSTLNWDIGMSIFDANGQLKDTMQLLTETAEAFKTADKNTKAIITVGMWGYCGFNKDLYILLLTGHKDLAPPLETIKRLDIQGYCEKSDKFDQLLLLIESGIKAIEQMNLIKDINKDNEKEFWIIRSSFIRMRCNDRMWWK